MIINIDLTSDFICPWCYIGEQLLFQEIDAIPEDTDLEVKVNWKQFELNPLMPIEGLDRKAYRTKKFGSWEYSQLLDAHTVETGKQFGVDFNYDRMKRTPNTFLVHRLTWLAAKEDKQRTVVENLFKGYFTEGKDIGDVDVVNQIAVDSGMNSNLVSKFLNSDDGTKEIRAQIQSAVNGNVNSVPNFNIEGKIIAGAEGSGALRRAILDVYKEKYNSQNSAA